MKDTRKQAIFRKDTRRAKRIADLWTTGDQDKGELEFFNSISHEEVKIQNSNLNMCVGSHQVPFPMCTLETLQKYCSTSSLLLTFC